MPSKPKRATLVTEHVTRHEDGTVTLGALAVADIVTTLLKSTGATSVQELIRRLEDGDEVMTAKASTIVLDEQQMRAIEAYPDVVSLIRIGATVAVTECDSCHAIQAVAGTIPTSCGMTLGCKGKPFKSSAARKHAYVEPV